MNKKIVLGALGGVVCMGLVSLHVAKADSIKVLPNSLGTYNLGWYAVPYPKQTFQTINESVCDGNTSYNVAYTYGNITAKSSFGVDLSAIPDGSIINQIQVSSCDALGSATNTLVSIQGFYIFNGVNSGLGDARVLATSTYQTIPLRVVSGLNLLKVASTTMEVGISTATNAWVRNSNLNATVYYTPPRPLAPTNLVATSTQVSQVVLNWTDNSNNEQGFKVERATSVSGPWTQIATFAPNVISAGFSETSGQILYYRVRAYTGGSNSAYSNTAAVLVK